MAGAVQAGALVIDMSVETAKVKTSLAENVRSIDSSSQKMAADLVAIRKGFEAALDPLKNLTVKVGSLESNIDKARSASFSLAKGMILGAAAGMSIDAIKNKVMGVIDSMAALKTTSEKTGSSVENLSKIGFFAKQAGSDIDTIAAAMNKMSKGMIGADDETKGAGAALSYLGLSAKDAAGNLKDPSVMLTEISKKMAGYQDGAGKVAIAQVLWGKSGADLLPTLKLMAEMGDISAKTTDAQATAARGYQRDLAKLDAQKGLLFKTIAISVLPTMKDFTGVLLDAAKNTNATNGAVKGLADDNSITDWADAAAMGLARLLDLIILIPKTLSAATAGAGLSMATLKALGNSTPVGMARSVANGKNVNEVFEQDAAEVRKAADKFAKATDAMWNYDGAAMEKAMAAKIAARAKLRASDAAAQAARNQAENGKPVLNYKPPDAEDDKAAAAALKLSKANLDARLNLEKTANARDAAIRKEGLADMAELNRQGIVSDTQLYVAKYNAALAAGTDVAAVKQREIDILKGYNGKDAAEQRAANGKIAVLEAERVEALRASGAEAEALRKQYIFDSDKPARDARAAADAEIAATYKQVDALKEQYANYGLLPEAITAINIAKLEKRAIDLEENEGSEDEININQRKLASLRALGDQQKKNSAQEAGTDVAKAKELLDILTAVDNAAKDAAAGMTASFGSVGTAIGGLTTALSSFARDQAAIAAQLATSMTSAGKDPDKIAKAQAAAAQQGAQAQIKSYGDMASAAKGFFKENSTGYKVMETAEKAFRAYEMAMAVESMVKKIFFKETEVAANLTLNATKVTGEATASAASTGLAATEASAWGITAVVKALASLPFPLNLAAGAATLAAVVAIGAKMLGGMGGSSVSLSEQRQAANGTGTVLGDSSAKSESIAHSLAIMEKNSGLGLAHTISMDQSLKQVVAGIGSLGGLLVRNSGLTGETAGATTGSASNIAQSMVSGPWAIVLGGVYGLISTALDKITGGWVSKTTGKIANAIFGGNTSVLDTGFTIGTQSLGSVVSNGVTASQYADTKTDGGWLHSDKKSTVLSGLGAEADDQFTKVILGLRSTVVGAADALGLGGAAFVAKLDAFKVDLGKVSLKDLKGDELQAALETAFSKLGDTMALAGVAGLEKYRAVGEGYLETLARVANDQMQVNDVLTVLGKSFNTTGLGAVALSQSLIAAAGDLETLTSNTSYFVQNFLTEAERMAPITKSVNDAMGKLGVSGVTTVDQFKALVLAQDLSTVAGQAMYAQLIALAEPFKTAADYAAELAAATGDLANQTKTASEIASERRDLQQQLNELTKTEAQLLAIQRAGIADVNKALFDQVQAAKAVVTAKDAVAKAYETEATAAKTALGTMKTWLANVSGFNASLAMGNLSTLTPEQRYAEARAQFEKTLAAANAGDTTAQSGLSAAEQAFLTASQVVNASDAKYVADYARVMAANDEAMRWASTQVDVQQASLDALTAQVSGLIIINDSVLTVAQAITNLQVAMGVSNGLGVEFTNAPAVAAQVALTSAPVPVVFDATRYSAGSNAGSDALVAEIRGLREDNKAMREEIKGLRIDQGKQTGAMIASNFDANKQAAKEVVAGVEKSAKTSAWGKPVEYQK